jgi:ubiquinone biosynthesis protein UbiJ
MSEVTNEFLARMIQSRFATLAGEISTTHHKLDMLAASLNDLASTHATHGEIEAVHQELNRLREDVIDLKARVRELEPADLHE